MDDEIKVGLFPPVDHMGKMDALGNFLNEVTQAGLDHVATGDHVSFHAGFGVDGLMNATAMATLTKELGIYVSVYLLALRHPVLVARQISTLASLAPGRLSFGIGVGGEDRHEIEICSVNPSTRGRRTDECIQILRGLFEGRPFDFDGEFFQLERALVLPRPVPEPPIVVGGRSSAAIKRAGLYGDGWIGTWVSAERFAKATHEIAQIAHQAGRENVSWQHAIQTWCGFGDSMSEARNNVASAMEGLYRIPFEKFERWSPFGTPDEVAQALFPYVEAGCRIFNLLPQAGNEGDVIAGTMEVKKRLIAHLRQDGR